MNRKKLATNTPSSTTRRRTTTKTTSSTTRRKTTDNTPPSIIEEHIDTDSDTDNITHKKMAHNRRFVIVTGDKGGTGKSIVARILLDIYRHRKIDCIAYECDQSNPQLYRYYNKLKPGVKTLKLNQPGGSDVLMNDMKKYKPSVSLLDLPAGAADYFEFVAKDIRLFQNAEKYNYKITTIGLIFDF